MHQKEDLMSFHLMKFGLDIDRDFLMPMAEIELGDPDYELKLRLLKERLDVARCTFDEIGIDSDRIQSARRKGAKLRARGIISDIMAQPGHQLNCCRINLLEREMKIAGIGLSEISMDKTRLMAALPTAGSGWLDVLPWEKRNSETVITGLLE